MEKIDLTWIIDDDPIFLFGIKRKLKAMNFSCDIVISQNGEEALNKLKAIFVSKEANLPDVILLDLNMPTVDGWQFLEEFDKMTLRKKVDIYLVTSSIDPVDVKRAETCNSLSGYLIKPVKTENLQEILENTRNSKPGSFFEEKKSEGKTVKFKDQSP